MIILPPIWWRRRERDLIRKARICAEAKRKQEVSRSAAEAAAFEARGPELRKRETLAGPASALGIGQPQDQVPAAHRTSAVPLDAERRAGGNQRAPKHRVGNAGEGGHSGAVSGSVPPTARESGRRKAVVTAPRPTEKSDHNKPSSTSRRGFYRTTGAYRPRSR